MNFCYSDYTKLLTLLKKRNICTFNNIKKNNFTLIRHDIDLDLTLALKMAEIEQKEKVKATYFIQLTCDTYNIFSKKNKEILSKILKMGHEIGLHFDTTSSKNVKNEFKFQIKLLSDFLKIKVRSVSLHNPSITNNFQIFKGYINSYDEKYFKNSIYISDSCMIFSKDNLLNYIKNIPLEKSLQILIHPLHFSKYQIGYDKILTNHIKRYSKNLHKNFLVNKTYRENKIKEIFFKV